MPYVMSLDCSTTSVKAIVWDLQGNMVAQGRAPLAAQTPAPGWMEQDAESWWQATSDAMYQALYAMDASQVAAVGLTWQRETFVALDADNQPLRPAILWCDQRAIREVEQAKEIYRARRFHRLSGKQLDTTPSFVKLAWMRAHEPELYRRIARVLDVGGYLAWRLTGVRRTCVASADSMGLVDIAAGRWSRSLLGYVGLRATQMARLVPPGGLLGRVTHEAALATGLTRGTPVIAAGGDGQVFAVGVRADAPDVLSLAVGTSLVLGAPWPTYRISHAYRTMVGCDPGTYLLEGVLRAGAEIVRWFVEDFAPSCRVAEMEAQIAAIPAGSLGLITVPLWKGRMVPTNEPLARGMTVGWSDYHTLAHFYRSILEGIAFEVRALIAAYEEELGIQTREIHLGGGGALSALWPQIMADVTGREVVLSAVESTSLGAAMLAAAGVGAYPSVRAASAAMYHPTARLRPGVAAAVYDMLYEKHYRLLYLFNHHFLEELGRFALEGMG